MTTQPEQANSLGQRLYRAFGPIVGGLILDFADLITLGPFGIWGGWLVGTAVAYWVGGFYRLSTKSRILLAIIGAIYCSIPFTEPIPLATLFFAACRFFEKPTTTVQNNPKRDAE